MTGREWKTIVIAGLVVAATIFAAVVSVVVALQA